MFRARAMLGLSTPGVTVLAAVRTAARDDPVGTPVAAGPERGHPADRIARKEEQADAFVPHPLDAAILPDVPVLIVADAEERLALEAPVGREHVAIGAIG